MADVELFEGTAGVTVFEYFDSSNPGFRFDLTDLKLDARDLRTLQPVDYFGTVDDVEHLGTGLYGLTIPSTVPKGLYLVKVYGNDADSVVDEPDVKVISIVEPAGLADTDFWISKGDILAIAKVDVTDAEHYQAQQDVDAAYNIDTSYRADCTPGELAGLAKAVMAQAVDLHTKAIENAGRPQATLAAGESFTETKEQDGRKRSITRSQSSSGAGGSMEERIRAILCPRAAQIVLGLPKCNRVAQSYLRNGPEAALEYHDIFDKWGAPKSLFPNWTRY